MRWAAAGVLAAVPAMAAAQDAAPPDAAASAPGGHVVVVGQRASLVSAQQIKRQSLPIVDSVVADDIMRLPDFSVTEALQRVTGVQIQRDRGEGTAVTVRGLSQVETTLNGREVFTAGTGRALDFADFPAELVAGIDVYKTSSAEHLEGGIGGLVDLRTRRPFDFAGSQVVTSARWVHGDLGQRDAPQLAALASQRWALASAGEFGALLSASLQRRAWREDLKSTGTPLLRPDIAPGATVASSTSETTSVGTRRRSAASAVLQWRPAPDRELYAEAAYQEFVTRQDSHQINASAPRAPAEEGAPPVFDPSSVVFFPGSTEVQRITWLNAPLSILSFARDTIDRNQQAALGGSWRGEALSVKADLSHARSYNNLFFSGPIFAGTAASFTHDVSGRAPSTRVDGTDLSDPANFSYAGIAYRTRPFRGELTAARVDGEWALDDGLLRALQGGLRLARRSAHNAPGLIFADAPVSGIGADDMPGFVSPNPFGNFFPDTGVASLRDYMVGNLALARDPAALREAFGITAPIPDSGNPLSLWHIGETTQAAYVQAPFEHAAWRLDGQFGLRAVRTHEAVDGYQSVPSSGDIAQIAIDSSYTDWLPSANLRWRPIARWTVRAAASKTVTRPSFEQLSPSLTLVPNPVDPRLNQGFAGNPALHPVRAENLDLALEHDAGAAGAVALTGFVKWVDGFVANASTPEMHDGQLYQVNRPYNSQRARIQGLELGGHWFFLGLPGAWRGLGVQASYTYIDSETPNILLAARTPLQGLSRNSANLIGLYEYGPVTARVAWNWRERFISGTTLIAGVGAFPAYTAGYSWLDASLQYRVNERLTVAVEGGNLSRTMRRSYYGSATRPQAALLNDRQYSIGATLRF
ncbi:TonB-dependent receptor [Ideonella sp.]|uniref:TonB-dependent receptor n=1 Tax=Ideonella sp. TaxID=1929293 RepID=UPI002B48DAAB|nr:TonB-dependent receptor [Ideonella sp.]HJV70500.1 TonB-dependent receptor [Ideonella sp.]